ncbi:MAG TPA: SDR family oxidoreductase [Aggregatilineaceae bacterium]|nr:SDR family oxidoreductase [Aggregatilineaceae bacterium]
MNGKVCLVTGATDGIGKVTALELAKRGAKVIGVGRNSTKIDATLREVGDILGSLEFLKADLSSLSEIRTLADAFRAKYDRLHVLVNNAGALFTTYRETVDGIEMTFALNHLSYFLLTNLLLDTIIASAPARIINVSSDAHYNNTIKFGDLGHKKNYNGWATYGASKLANILFTHELARRLAGTGVTVNAVHPGFVHTNFQTAAGLNMRGPLSPEEGADTQIWLAASNEVEGVTGKFFVRRRETKSSDESYDQTTARRLWEVSEELTRPTP